jgi:hypothetical protein
VTNGSRDVKGRAKISSRLPAKAMAPWIVLSMIGLAGAAGLVVVYETRLTLKALALLAALGTLRWAWTNWTRGRLETQESSAPALQSWVWIWLLSSLITLVLLRPWLVALGAWNGSLAGLDLIICLLGFTRGFSPNLRPIQTIWFCFQFSWMGVAPVYLVSHQVAAWGDNAIWAQTSAVRAAFELNLLCAVTGFVAFTWAASRPASAAANRGVARDRSLVRWVYLGLAVLLFPRAVSYAGGIGGLFQSRQAYNAHIATAGVSAPSAAFSAALPGIVAIAAAFLFLKRAVDRRLAGRSAGGLNAGGTLVALGLAFVLNNPWAFRRADVAAALGPLLMVAWRPRRARAGLIFAASALFALLIIYPLSKAFSGGGSVGAVGTAAFASGDFDGFQQLVNSVLYVGAEGHTWGSTSLAAIFYFVPRAVWHAKSIPASWLVAGHAGYSFLDLSMPFQSEMYLEFGVLGIALVVGAVCWGLARLDAVWLTAPDSRLAALVPYATFGVLYLIRGPSGTSTPIYLTTAVLLWLGLGNAPSGPLD